MIYLTLPELLHVAERTLGPGYLVHDAGLLESALARPRTVVFGLETYPSMEEKAAALLHSITRNHALVDGNKRLGLAALIAFFGINGHRLTLTNDGAYDMVMSVASGKLDTVPEIVNALRTATEPYG